MLLHFQQPRGNYSQQYELLVQFIIILPSKYIGTPNRFRRLYPSRRILLTPEDMHLSLRQLLYYIHVNMGFLLMKNMSRHGREKACQYGWVHNGRPRSGESSWTHVTSSSRFRFSVSSFIINIVLVNTIHTPWNMMLSPQNWKWYFGTNVTKLTIEKS